MLLSGALLAGWSDVTSLDEPIALPRNEEKARGIMLARTKAQIAANEAFLRASPDDPHVMESRIRLASAEGRLASLTGDKAGIRKSLQELKALERTTSDRKLRAEAMFRRTVLEWQDLGDTSDLRRENARNLALGFADAFPDDRRSARLLAEAAALCNYHPEKKSQLIDKALSLCSDETLLQRLQDDKRQLSLLGRPLDLRFTATDGKKVDLQEERGRVTAVIFWSSESAPSLVWLGHFAKFADGVPSLNVVMVSLDRNKADMEAALKSLHIIWPTAFDGEGWQNAIARKYGINTLPTLWLVDRRGNLAYLNAREDYEHRVNELLLKR